MHPRVVDVAVVGLPDHRWGEVVAAAVVSTPGEPLPVAELDAVARGRLAGAKVPRRWILLDRLPRNANGKVDREALRRWVALQVH